MIDQVFAISKQIRYVAIYQDGALQSHQRPGLKNSSASESDKYEELFVNPTLLKCASQRGELDCGGCRWLIVGYGNFMQFVMPIRGGHLSVCFEQGSNPVAFAGQLAALYPGN